MWVKFTANSSRSGLRKPLEEFFWYEKKTSKAELKDDAEEWAFSQFPASDRFTYSFKKAAKLPGSARLDLIKKYTARRDKAIEMLALLRK
jgi:hypothetical protein